MIVSNNRSNAFLIPILLIGLLTIIGAITLLILVDDAANPFKDMYLMPWVIMVGFVLSLPSLYLFYKKKFDFFHPLVFAAWSYFIPAFFLGGLILASGLSKPYFLAYIEDEQYNLPLTLVYVAIGYICLTIGFYLPISKKAANKISARLPVWNWKSEQVLFPALMLLLMGLINTIMAFILGILGFQRADAIGAFDGLIFLLTLFWLEASFLLWLAIFRTKTLNINHYLIIGLLFWFALTKSAYQGNRGSLFQIFILISCAFIYSRRPITFRHKVYGAVLLVAAVVGGMIYGTTFRNVKQTEATVSMAEYTENILTTFDQVAEQDLGSTFEQGLTAMAERIEAVSTLGVVVSNYEKLEPYEESYGLDHNIYKDSVTFFVPRPLWQDKPIASEPRKYSDLYFNFAESSFGITPIGDLLRNFGPYGIVFGMLFLGIVIRFIYSTLIENQEFSYWRTTLYYMLLTAISYEGFFGTIIPYLIKVAFIVMIGILILWFLMSRTRSAAPKMNYQLKTVN